MKKLLSILGAISVVATTSSTVISCQTNKIPLATVILVQDLGKITMAGSAPTLDELIAAIQAKNPGATTLNTENVGLVGQSTATTAVVQGLREYQDNVTLIYNGGGTGPGPEPTEKNLTKIIANNNLGAIVMVNMQKPDPSELLQGIVDVNPVTAKNLSVDDFTASAVTGTNATVTGKNGYTGTVNLRYTRQLLLTNIIKNTNLGQIVITEYPNGPSPSELLVGIKAANNPRANKLVVSDFAIVGTSSTTGATITGAGDYQSTVNLTYTLQNDISKLITTLNLGPIVMNSDTPTLNELLAAVKLVNPNAAGLNETSVIIAGVATPTYATLEGLISPYIGAVTLVYRKAI